MGYLNTLETLILFNAFRHVGLQEHRNTVIYLYRYVRRTNVPFLDPTPRFR